jgi:hypothetical protein
MTISTPGNAVDGTIAAVVFHAVEVANGTVELHISFLSIRSCHYVRRMLFSSRAFYISLFLSFIFALSLHISQSILAHSVHIYVYIYIYIYSYSCLLVFSQYIMSNYSL